MQPKPIRDGAHSVRPGHFQIGLGDRLTFTRGGVAARSSIGRGRHCPTGWSYDRCAGIRSSHELPLQITTYGLINMNHAAQGKREIWQNFESKCNLREFSSFITLIFATN
jgi:hypothetical protein